MHLRAFAPAPLLLTLAGCAPPPPPPASFAPYGGPTAGDGYNDGDIRITPITRDAAGTPARTGDSDVTSLSPQPALRALVPAVR